MPGPRQRSTSFFAAFSRPFAAYFSPSQNASAARLPPPEMSQRNALGLEGVLTTPGPTVDQIIDSLTDGSPRPSDVIDIHRPSPFATPEGYTAATLVSELPGSEDEHLPSQKSFDQQGTWSGKLNGFRDTVMRADLIPKTPPYQEEGHLHTSEDPHCWAWLDCPDGLQVFISPHAAIEYAKFVQAQEDDIHNLAMGDFDRVYYAFDAMYDHARRCKPKHPVRGLIPSDTSYALPWGWRCPDEIHRLVTRYELVHRELKTLPDSAFNGLPQTKLSPADHRGRRWLLGEHGKQFQLSPNIASQYSLLESIFRDAHMLQSPHGHKLYGQAHYFLEHFPMSCELFACFEGSEPRNRTKFVVENFRYPEVEYLIWDYEKILAGVESSRTHRSMNTLRTMPTPLTTTLRSHATHPGDGGNDEEPSAHEVNARLPEDVLSLTEGTKCFPTIKSPYQVLKQKKRKLRGYLPIL